MTSGGDIVASSGSITALELPSGPGVRVDTAVRIGSAVDPRFDSLLAKVVVRSRPDSYERAVAKLAVALDELRVGGVATNAGMLRRLLDEEEVVGGIATTEYVDANVGRLADALTDSAPLPTLRQAREISAGLDGLATVVSPMTGVAVAVEVAVGDAVGPGSAVVVLEAMKMEHLVVAGTAGIVRDLLVAPGDAVEIGDVLAFLQPADVPGSVNRDSRRDRSRGDPARSGRVARTAPAARRRRPSGRYRAPARQRPANGKRARGGPVRRRELRGVRRFCRRRPVGAAIRPRL